MQIDIQEYKKIANEIESISKGYVSTDSVIKFKNHIEDKLNNFKPTLMIYGIYNAGKSTLLNAIFGEREKAKTSDIPETSIIQAYEYKGYTIYDTPGINAPREHEEVTEEHLKKCELVLFVIGNIGSFEDRYIYEKIANILIAKKPILIVLNNKAKHSPNSQELINEINKVNENLSKICDEFGIVNAELSVDIITVDALDALDGKVENEMELIENSNILNLENKINIILGSSGAVEVSNALNKYITSFIEDTIVSMDNQIDDFHTKQIEDLITFLEKLKQKILVEVKEIIATATVIITQQLIQLFLQRDKKAIEVAINSLTLDLKERIDNLLKQAYDDIKQKVKDTEEEFFKVELNKLEVEELKSLTQTISNSDYESNNSSINAMAVGQLVKYIPDFHPLVTLVKPFVPLVLAVFSIFSSSSEASTNARAELEEKRNYHMAAKNQADDLGFKFKNQMEQDVVNGVLNLFNGLIEKYIQISEKLNKDKQKNIQDKKRLLEILNALNK